MPISTYEMWLSDIIDQSLAINQVTSGKYNKVSVNMGLDSACEELLQVLEESYLPTDIALDYISETTHKITRAAFGYTKVISRFVKKAKGHQLNINRVAFSFSKYNADDLMGLLNWPVLRSLELEYFVNQATIKDATAEQKKYKDKQFFNNLAEVILKHKSIASLNLNCYGYSSNFNGSLQLSKDEEELGLVRYFPYEDYDYVKPDKANITLDASTTRALLKAFVINHSLLEINIPEIHFDDIEKCLRKNKLLEQLKQSYKELDLELGDIQTVHQFFQAILLRNRVAAAKLRMAIVKGDSELVKKLLAKGVSTSATDKYGSTALHYAVQEGHIDIVQMLKKCGSDWRLANKKDETPISLAQRHGRYVIADILSGKNIATKPVVSSSKSSTKKMGGTLVLNSSSDIAYSSKKEEKFTKKVCPLTKLFGFFNNTSKPVKSYTAAVQPIIDTFPKALFAIDNIQTVENVAREIANAAITGAINGLRAIPGGDPNNVFDPYNALSGLAYNANFPAEERNKLVNLIAGQLLVVQNLDLTTVNDVTKRCLIGCLAIQLKNMNFIIIDDSKVDMVSVTNNSTIKMSEKITGLQAAVGYAVNDATNKMLISSIPTAPPTDDEIKSSQLSGALSQPVPVMSTNF